MWRSRLDAWLELLLAALLRAEQRRWGSLHVQLGAHPTSAPSQARYPARRCQKCAATPSRRCSTTSPGAQHAVTARHGTCSSGPGRVMLGLVRQAAPSRSRRSRMKCCNLSLALGLVAGQPEDAGAVRPGQRDLPGINGDDRVSSNLAALFDAHSPIPAGADDQRQAPGRTDAGADDAGRRRRDGRGGCCGRGVERPPRGGEQWTGEHRPGQGPLRLRRLRRGRRDERRTQRQRILGDRIGPGGHDLVMRKNEQRHGAGSKDIAVAQGAKTPVQARAPICSRSARETRRARSSPSARRLNSW